MDARPRHERLLRRESAIILLALSAVVGLCTAFLLMGAGTGMSTLGMAAATGPAGALLGGIDALAAPMHWSTGTIAAVFTMWWLMMVAMMVPSAAPAVLLYAALSRGAAGATSWNTAFFLGGYLIAWAAFSLAATLVQWLLSARGAMSPMYMTLISGIAGASLMVLAGLYQFTPLKRRCLQACRGPVQSLLQHWRPGPSGALRAGLALGTRCLGCCWVLMLLLFVGGVMNLYWIIGIAAYVGAEKLAPAGSGLARFMGGLLILAGLALLARETGILPV